MSFVSLLPPKKYFISLEEISTHLFHLRVHARVYVCAVGESWGGEWIGEHSLRSKGGDEVKNSGWGQEGATV